MYESETEHELDMINDNTVMDDASDTSSEGSTPSFCRSVDSVSPFSQTEASDSAISTDLYYPSAQDDERVVETSSFAFPKAIKGVKARSLFESFGLAVAMDGNEKCATDKEKTIPTSSSSKDSFKLSVAKLILIAIACLFFCYLPNSPMKSLRRAFPAFPSDLPQDMCPNAVVVPLASLKKSPVAAKFRTRAGGVVGKVAHLFSSALDSVVSSPVASVVKGFVRSVWGQVGTVSSKVVEAAHTVYEQKIAKNKAVVHVADMVKNKSKKG